MPQEGRHILLAQKIVGKAENDMRIGSQADHKMPIGWVEKIQIDASVLDSVEMPKPARLPILRNMSLGQRRQNFRVRIRA
ncbi:hypothetical protein GCM10027565_07220 [Bordetella tumulicola]